MIKNCKFVDKVSKEQSGEFKYCLAILGVPINDLAIWTKKIEQKLSKWLLYCRQVASKDKKSYLSKNLIKIMQWLKY